MSDNGTSAKVGDKMNRRMRRAYPDLQAATIEGANVLRALIVANASGRPGPEIQSGAYVSSWKVNTSRSGVTRGTITVSVSSNASQARRLEYGYVGTDSAGRHYAQPPYPHVRPAVDEARPIIARLIAQAIAKTVKDDS